MENKYLPLDFQKNMKELLKDEYEDFVASYEKERHAGLRFNPLKTDLNSFLEAMPFEISSVPWAEEGFYYNLNDRPGKHPFHEAGAYYIQEPSAMSAVAALDPKPGDYCLDLCAAPGGKSTQIAGRLRGEGLLVSNEIVPNRSVILSGNLERMGVRNAVCLNENASKLSGRFPSFFDKILVDAPCSGEGMFKKEENATGEWSIEHVNMCANRQLEILNEASKMLKAGGSLVYSTCTFNPLENESVISAFLMDHPEFKIEKSDVAIHFSPGRPEWVRSSLNNPDWGKDTSDSFPGSAPIQAKEGIENGMRLWPHKINGEGHFVIKLHKEGELSDIGRTKPVLSKKDQAFMSEVKAFLQDVISVKSDVMTSFLDNVIPVTFGENVYLMPAAIGSLTGLKVQRAGLHIAVIKKNRWEPSHALALSLRPADVETCITLNETQAAKYIAGDTLNCDPSIKGWVLLSAGPFSIGFGKASGGVIKNHFPKGLRIYT